MIRGSPDPFPIFEGGVRLRQTSRDPSKVESCVSVGTLSLCTGSYSLTKTLSYCSPAFDRIIRIYLCPNLSFAALFHVEYSSYDSLVWHTRVLYLVVLIEHIVDWIILTRLSGERPRIHGVRLSVAYSSLNPSIAKFHHDTSFAKFHHDTSIAKFYHDTSKKFHHDTSITNTHSSITNLPFFCNGSIIMELCIVRNGSVAIEV